MMKIKKAPLFAAIVVFSFLAGPLITTASANTYYVATTGLDTNPGTISQPWLTIHKAASVMVAGDTTYIRGGTYDISSTITPANSGSAAVGYITFSAYQDELPVLDGANRTIKAFSLTSSHSYFRLTGLKIQNFQTTGAIGITRNDNTAPYPHHIEVLNCTMINNPGRSWVKVFGGHDIIFAGCTFVNAKQGIELAVLNKGFVYNVQIIDCNFSNMSWEGVVAKAVHDSYYDPIEWCEDVYLTGCESSYCDDDGFDLFGRYFTVEHCIAHNIDAGIDGHGFKVYDLDLPVDEGRYHADFYRCLTYSNIREGYKLTSLTTEESVDYREKFRMRNCTAADDKYGISLVTNETHPMDVTIKNCLISGTDCAWEITGSPVIWASSDSTMAMTLPGYLTLDSNYNLWHADINDPINYLGSYYTLAGWQATSGQDANSISVNPTFDANYAPTNATCIDSGIDVGLPYAGSAPDMGFVESGTVEVNCPTGYLTTGENWISIPVAAINDGAYSVFKDLGTWPNSVYHNLYRYDSLTASFAQYPTYQSDAVQFGKITPGGAYKLTLGGNQSTINVSGVELKQPQTLSIGGSGTRDFYFGNPFNKTVYTSYCAINYNGSEVSIEDAITNGWVGNFEHFNPATKTWESMGNAIETWHAYRLNAYNTSGELKLLINYTLPGDLDSDGDVDWDDVGAMSLHWLDSDLYISPTGDLDGDLDVDFKDFARLAGNWLKGT